MTMTTQRRRDWTAKEIRDRAVHATAATRWTNAQMKVMIQEIDAQKEQIEKQHQQIKLLTQLINTADIDTVTRTALAALGIRLPKEKTTTKKK